jgi:ATP/ADP translocase
MIIGILLIFAFKTPVGVNGKSHTAAGKTKQEKKKKKKISFRKFLQATHLSKYLSSVANPGTQ